MNQISRANRDRDELALLRAVVERQVLPEFVAGFDTRIGEFDGDPAAWITFKLTGSDAVGLPELTRRAEILAELRKSIRDDWFDEGGDAFPYFRSEYMEPIQPS